MARGKKVRPRAWTPRDRQDCRRLFDVCGGDRDEFDRRVDAELRGPKHEPQRGRPQNTFFTEFLADPGPQDGLFVVRCRFDDGEHVQQLVSIVSPQKHWVNKLRRGKIEIVTPNEAFRPFVRRVWKKYEKLGRAAELGLNEDAVARRVADDLREAIKSARRREKSPNI